MKTHPSLAATREPTILQAMARDYGYLESNSTRRFETLEQLTEALKSKNDSLPAWVWTPQTATLVPPEAIPELLPAVRYHRILDAEDDFALARQRSWIMGALFGWSVIAALGRYAWSQALMAPAVLMSAIMLCLFAVIPAIQARRALKRARGLTPETMLADAPLVRYESWLATFRTPITRVIVGMLVAVAAAQFLLEYFHGGTGQAAGGLVRAALNPQNPALSQLLTGPMLHGNLLHLVFNIFALLYLAPRLESLSGWPHLVLCALVSQIGGGLASLAFTPSISVGYSGAIMGILGYLIVFEFVHRDVLPKSSLKQLLSLVAGTAILGVVGFAFIDNAAHAAGLFAGAGYAFLSLRRGGSRPAQAAGESHGKTGTDREGLVGEEESDIPPLPAPPIQPNTPGAAVVVLGVAALGVMVFAVVLTLLKLA